MNFKSKLKLSLLFIALLTFVSCTKVVEKHYSKHTSKHTSSIEVRAEELRSRLVTYADKGIDINNIFITVQGDSINISFQDNILFDLNKYKIKEKYKNILNMIGNYLIENPTLEITVEGHTDNTGEKEYNLVLSEKRAQSVKDSLVEFSVSSDRINIVGYGEDVPLFENTTREGRRKNRRAEIFLRESMNDISETQKSLSSQPTYTKEDEVSHFSKKKYAHYKAYAACSTAYLGCELAAIKVKGAFKEHGLAQGCSLVQNQMQGKDYEANDVMKTFVMTVMDSVASDLRNSESIGDKILGYIGGGILLNEKVKAFNECTESMENKYLYE